MQDLEKALSHLADIHSQLSRTEHYRGLHSFPIALTGISGVLAAALQPWLLEGDPVWFVFYWSTVAILNTSFVGLGLGFEYLRSHTAFERRKTHAVLLQFMPALLAGLLLTVVALQWQETVLLQCLPGLWALLFSLGVFACRPFFPQHLFWLGLFYLLAAAVLLSMAPSGYSLHPWGMGLTFGVGQLLAALLIYWEIERHEQ